MNAPKFIVVVGASGDGVDVMREFLSQLSTKADAAYFIVLHLSGRGITDLLLYRLQGYTKLNCRIAQHQEKIEKNTIYFAPSHMHLLVKKDQIVIGQGPAENSWRPSIDVLFRSAAAAFGPRVIGVVLTGLLNDGAAGMSSIKRSGGKTIVQDPIEAEFPDMPLSVLNIMEVDYCITLSEMGEIIKDLTEIEINENFNIPSEVIAETEIAESVYTSITTLENISGEHSIYSCPDCGGGLWYMKHDKVARYRCHVGHVYNEQELFNTQRESLEATLWLALRMLEERCALLEKMAKDERKKSLNTKAAIKEEHYSQLQVDIGNLKEILFNQQIEDEKENFQEGT